MDLGIGGKRALVTGAAVGIGQAIAVDLAKEGATVAITSRNSEAIEKTLRMMGGREAGHYGCVCNIEEQGAPEKLLQELWKEFGQIDILINNVGSTQGILDPYCSIRDWHKVFRLNLEVAIELNNLAIPYMKKQDWGRIVNITAGAALENSGPVEIARLSELRSSPAVRPAPPL